VASYASIITNDSTLLPVIRSLKLSVDPDTLAKSIKTTVVPLTVLIKIEVTNQSPDLAADIANAICKQFEITAQNLEIGSPRSSTEKPVKITTVQTAVSPTIPSAPKKTRNYFLGLVAGLILSLGSVNLRGFFDRKMKNEKQLDGVPLLGAVRFLKEFRELNIMEGNESFSEKAETYRMVRTNVQYLRDGRKSLVLAITSSVPQEGKSTTSISLALSFARAGIKTMVIEGDMRRPSFIKYLKHTEELGDSTKLPLGLSEILTQPIKFNHKSISPFISKFSDGNLSIITSGNIPPNPAEILSSSRLRDFINYAKKHFEITIIDCPPALAVTDSLLISTVADATILVIHAGVTTVEQFQITKRTYENVSITLAGAILNKIPRSRRKSSSYGYYYGSKSENAGVYFTPLADYTKKYRGYYNDYETVAIRATPKKNTQPTPLKSLPSFIFAGFLKRFPKKAAKLNASPKVDEMVSPSRKQNKVTRIISNVITPQENKSEISRVDIMLTEIMSNIDKNSNRKTK
jgi:capsular exopolysaccharide synthesis family protein